MNVNLLMASVCVCTLVYRATEQPETAILVAIAVYNFARFIETSR